MTENIPKIIIIIPYRDRKNHRDIFMKHMPPILSGKDYKIMVIHQHDGRLFNRGAIKNIGFKVVKEKYPDHYKHITLVFHDIDWLPLTKGQFSYDTEVDSVNHFFGYTQTLGGIFAIKGCDFEKINGFPNIWTWGLEDNALKMRCDALNISINRDEFINIKDNARREKMIQLDHGYNRIISPNIESKLNNSPKVDGINSLYNIQYRVHSIDQHTEEVLVRTFETPEKFTSPLIKYAKELDSRKYLRMNRIINIPKPGDYRHKWRLSLTI